MNKVKIVALNSGGLDSVVLMHHLNEKFPNVEVHTLFFDYGQKALEFERKASRDVATKLGYKWEEITINPFKWSNSSIVDSESEESYNSLYLEMRNMIFVSYATSYAQSIGAVKVYGAIIKPPEDPYPDATAEFSEKISAVMSLCGLEFCTPFITYDKQYIFMLARKYGIGLNDFCSCFKTEKNEGDMCSNCQLISEYSEYFDESNALEDTYHRLGDSDKYIDLVRKRGKITSAKLSINNSCNLRCPYCLMTGVDHTDKPTMSLSDIVDKLYSFGIKKFDIFGKEPLFDDTAINLLEQFKDYQDIYFSMITNGKNLDNYAPALINSKLQEITVSFDGGAYRPFTVEDSTLTYLIENGLPVSISIDLHNKNWFELNKFLVKFYKLGVSSVYIKPIEDWGGCDKSYSISEDLYDSVINEVVSSEFPIPLVMFSIPFKYRNLTKKYSDMFKYDIPQYSDRPIYFDLDPVCASGYTSIFVNYDGKVYGCGNCAYERPKTGIDLSEIKDYDSLKNAVCNFSGRNCCNPIDNKDK